MLNIVKPTLPHSCRIICVSDIHTNWYALQQLLDKCGYRPNEDFLFVLGDILERGSDNLNCLRYMMKLAENRRVHIIEGNNDMYVHGLAVRYEDDKFLQRFGEKPNCCYGEMAAALGITDFSENTAEKRREVYQHFKAELDFMQSLPDCIETEQHIFIHAGLPDTTDWQNSDSTKVKLIPRFIERHHSAEKTVVCGHFPCYAIGRENSNLPLFDSKRKIIDIDGGAGVKRAQQLNALILTKNGSEYTTDVMFQPIGQQRTVAADVKGSDGWIFADYENHTFTKLSSEDIPCGFIRVQNNLTGDIGIVPECMSGCWDGELHVWGNLNSFPSAVKGEPIWVYGEYYDYCWCITAGGEVGSIPLNAIE